MDQINAIANQPISTPKQKTHEMVYGLLGAILSFIGYYFLQFMVVEGGGGGLALLIFLFGIFLLLLMPIIVTYKFGNKASYLTLAWELFITSAVLILVARPLVYGNNKNLVMLVNILMGFISIITLFYLLPVSVIARLFRRNSDKLFWNKIILLSLASLASIFVAYSISSFVVSCCV